MDKGLSFRAIPSVFPLSSISEFRLGATGAPIFLINKDDTYNHSDFFLRTLQPIVQNLKFSEGRGIEYLAGRFLCRFSLERMGFPNYTVTSGQHREPIWPEGVVGSISHSNDYIVCITTRRYQSRGVGIDVERVGDSETIRAISSMALKEEERQLIQGLAHLATPSILTTVAFSAKESFFKAIFYHIYRYIDFDAITLQSIDLTSKTFNFHINDDSLLSIIGQNNVQADYALLDKCNVLTILSF